KDLLNAIATILGGEPWIDPVLAGELYREIVDGEKKVEDASSAQPLLTPRELEILKLIVHGYTNPKIAQELVVSIETVKTHIKHILEKL
ncbi:LuxR C-terminal-related transcriptional regulator, partial [Acinetobacter baumannii]